MKLPSLINCMLRLIGGMRDNYLATMCFVLDEHRLPNVYMVFWSERYNEQIKNKEREADCMRLVVISQNKQINCSIVGLILPIQMDKYTSNMIKGNYKILAAVSVGWVVFSEYIG